MLRPSLGTNPASPLGQPAALPTTPRRAQPHFAPLSFLLGRQELLSSVPISLHTSQVLLCQRQVQGVDPRCCMTATTFVAWRDSPPIPSHCRHTLPILGGCRSSSPLPPDPTLFLQILHSPSHPEAAPSSGHPKGTPSGQPSPARSAPCPGLGRGGGQRQSHFQPPEGRLVLLAGTLALWASRAKAAPLQKNPNNKGGCLQCFGVYQPVAVSGMDVCCCWPWLEGFDPYSLE